MANLSSLVHELRERIAASSSTPTHSGDDAALEARFRAVLPNLLHAYVVPSSSANEREVIAVLKLISHTAKNFPGVFYHGKASAVLPVVARVIPFLAEPALSQKHGVIFETVDSLISLLRKGERTAYCQFFEDAMFLIGDLVYVGEFHAGGRMSTWSKQVSVKCFCGSLTGIFGKTTIISDIPQIIKPTDGFGVLIDVSDEQRWQTLAIWILKLIQKCLTDGNSYVQGLVGGSFLFNACSLLHYGDVDLQMAFFDFARITSGIMDHKLVPYVTLIQVASTILSKGKDELPRFRNVIYDSSLGSCLHVLHSSCPVEVVKCTASDLVSVTSKTLLNTTSHELKVALCKAYSRIAKSCPPDVWMTESLVHMLCHPESLSMLIDCFHVALPILGLEYFGGKLNNDTVMGKSIIQSHQFSRVGEKRTLQDLELKISKRQKTDDTSNGSGSVVYEDGRRQQEHARQMQETLASFFDKLEPIDDSDSGLSPEFALKALCMLCIAFSKYPKTPPSCRIYRQVYTWLPWISNKVRQGSTLILDLPLYLEAVHAVLISQSHLSMEEKLFRNLDDDLKLLLKLTWGHSSTGDESCTSFKSKCISVQIFSKLGLSQGLESDFEVWDMSILDEAEDVRIEAFISMPLMVFGSGAGALLHFFKRLEFLRKDRSDKVKKILPHILGYLSCLYGSFSGVHDVGSDCQLFLNMEHDTQTPSADLLLQSFWCPRCDKRVQRDNKMCFVSAPLTDVNANEVVSGCDFLYLQSVFFDILYNDSSEEIQLSCVSVMHRIFLHGPTSFLQRTQSDWIKCIEFLLLHKKKAVREAFSSQIRFFVENSLLTLMVSDAELMSKPKEQLLLDKIKLSLESTEEPLVFISLMESTVQIMIGVDIENPLFLCALILLVDQLDNPSQIVKLTASKLVHDSCNFHNKGGLKRILSEVGHIQSELFDYLSFRLQSRPKMIQEFSEAVLGISTEELVKKMIPIIVPKLVVAHQDNDLAVPTLYELAKCVKIDMVPLIVNWLPKVLSFALIQEEGKELFSALQFYHAQTGSDSEEIFAAALPALLDEIICFLDDDSDKIIKRLARVPQMIKEVARVITGTDDLPNFLKNHFVGLLNSIDRKMLHSENQFLQNQALKRIEMLIEMMGCYLGTYVPKLMVLLMHAIEKEALQGEGLTVLHFFIEQLASVSPSSIKHVISQVFAALVPFLEREEDNPSLHLNKVVNILEELVFRNRSILKQHISEFPPLPTIPVLMELNKVLQEARGLMTFKDQLRVVVDWLDNENLNVRYMVACELRKLLNLGRDDATSLITGDIDSDMDVLSSLITSLLRGCAEESRTALGQRIKLVCADCLGALGAVDPAKVKGFSGQRFKIECSDDDLIFELIHKHLARAFRAAPDTIVQDSAALAIQELLKIAGCEASLDVKVSAYTSQVLKDRDSAMVPTSKSRSTQDAVEMSNRGQRLWGRFSNYVKEIIAPCLTSRFQLPNVTDSTHSGPIYRPSLSFRRWIFYWIKKLTVLADGSRSKIFNSCRAIVRHDMQTATYLLPYLVLNAVCHGNEDARRGIADEILTVLNAVAAEKAGTGSTVGAGGQSEVCIQSVFTLLDNLGQWVDDVGRDIALTQSLQSNSKQQGVKNKKVNPNPERDQLLIQCKYVSELLDVIPKVTLAKASFGCQAYARSLMYFESHVREKSGSCNPAAERSGIFEDEDITFMMEVYSSLDEPDGISGLLCLRKTLSLQDQLLMNKRAGNWAEAFTSCEKALLREPCSVQRYSDVLNCLLNMCHRKVMVTCVNGLIKEVPQYEKTWCTQGLQAAWRLGKWDLMDNYLDGANKEGSLCSMSESNGTFDIDVAKILQAMIRKDQFSVAERLALSKQALIAPLAAAGMDSYTRAYPYVVKLHMLRELEDFHSILLENSFLDKSFRMDDPGFSKFTDNLENRLRFTQSSLWAREPLLSFRRLVFGASGLDSHVGICWLQYAKLCRTAGHYETADLAISEAGAYGAPNVHIEKAKLLWGTGRSDSAISELQQFLLKLPREAVGPAILSSVTSVPINQLPLVRDSQVVDENRNIAKTLLLYARWSHYTGKKQKEDVISYYARVKELQPKWEKGYFYMAKYCDELLADARKRQDHTEFVPNVSSSSVGSQANSNTEKRWWSYVPDVLLFYAKGLHRGHKNLFQALPRLLTLWFEFGIIYERSGPAKKDLAKVHSKVTNIMKSCLKDLPTYQWLTVLPQLVSRICHQNGEVVTLVKLIVTSVLRQYPQQALWIMAAVSKSTVPSRREAAAEIIKEARQGSGKSTGGGNLFVQFASLMDHLIKLCFHQGQSKTARTINILTEFSALKRMMPVDIIMPLQQSLTVNLPTCDSGLTEANPFGIFSGTDIPTISGIADEAEILSSLQRPKKVVLVGSDGLERPFLCKPKDDLRKDARMMEFTAMINRLLSKYPESCRRKLYIRTFAVIPLTEDCGMIEWVPHTRGLRHILQDIYITCGKFDRQTTNPNIKRIYDQYQGKISGEEMLKTKILPMFPPVFHKWFLNTFSEPAAWFRARLSYAHTTAVWSMVGHIVGLGDRHGENILFDSTTGDCVHVDFSCLFDKGLQLEKPELVPFRLTQNIIDGLGITGYEGPFLKVCQITLTVLRTHRETLMSTLETFIHDPLVEWTKSHKSSGVEVQNPHAQKAISNIEARLQGVVVGVGATPSLPLGVEGQVRRLIDEAVSHKNLGKMYIWWMPWF